VNDAAVELGSNRDRHAVIGRGRIAEGLATFLAHPALQSLPAISETWEEKAPTRADIERLRELHRTGTRSRKGKKRPRRR
jgi:endonuclease IV